MPVDNMPDLDAPILLNVQRLKNGGGVGFTTATVLPSRGMMLLHLTANLGDGNDTPIIVAPPLEQAMSVLDNEPASTRGNASFSMGGAVLLPFAN